VASFAYGRKVVCHPKWSQLATRIGRPIDPSNGRKMAKKLEQAGLVKRGEFGQADRWRLILKEQILKETGSIHPPTGSNLPAATGSIHPPTGSNLPSVNNKKNNRNKDYSLEKKEDRLILVSGVLLSTSEVVSLTKSKPRDLKLIQRIEDLQYLEEIVSDQIQKIMIRAEIERRETEEEDLRRLLEESESEEEFKLVFETESGED
jgi:hypothetical protein